MPIELKELKTKSGHFVLRTDFVTEVTLADVQKYQQQTPAGQHDGWGFLVVGNVTGVSSEVKKALSSRTAKNPMPVALVLASPLMRMTASLVMRVVGTGSSDSFKTEAEALEWLDVQLTQLQRKH